MRLIVEAILFGNLIHAVMHTANIRDRDGAPLVLREIIRLFPWLQHSFADGRDADEKVRQAPVKIGKSKWALKIIKRSDKAKASR